MGWRFSWRVYLERTDRVDTDRGGEWPRLVKWAIIGFAVVGVASFMIFKGWVT